jgi:hypothetical protein
VFAVPTTDGETLRKAHAVMRAAPFAPERDDSAEAIRELQQIGAQRWPSQPHQQFARAMEVRVDLAKRACRQPSPRTSFPFPR